ncbi:MAG: NAD(P)/FAD-dependent oxidoreductase [Acidimicrobiales bacterium]
MTASYDVVVVGGRCAGSPLAAQLARAGLSVAVVDRAQFPSDTASTHIFQVEGVNCLARLGVLDAVLTTGAPWLERVDVRFDGFHADGAIPLRPADAGPGLCVRRHRLDAILVEAAQAAGAEVHTATRVVGLLHEGARVTGVRVQAGDQERELRARLVVGADGAGSTVARLVGARSYSVVANQRFGYWAYFEGAGWDSPATLVYHRLNDDLVIAAPADSGLYLVIVLPALDGLAAFRSDVEAGWASVVARCEPVASALVGARRVERFRSMANYPAFFRESSGPGWVLVGDAGHVSDPTPGQGISDALRQVDRLAPAIVAGLAGAEPLDDAMARWWRWRDADGAEMHWFASDLGAAGPVPAVITTAMRRVGTQPGGLDHLIDIFNHRLAPSQVITPAGVMVATADLLLSARGDRRGLVAQTCSVIREDLRRRRRNRRPRYQDHPTGTLGAP